MSKQTFFPCPYCDKTVLVVDHQPEQITEVFLVWQQGRWGEPLDEAQCPCQWTWIEHHGH